ncbi:MAG: hypothetical protein GF331_25650 [Chitinivibrionales bacterium]|nr:hypothetical protein [Chitinivibrionales bacterium]
MTCFVFRADTLDSTGETDHLYPSSEPVDFVGEQWSVLDSLATCDFSRSPDSVYVIHRSFGGNTTAVAYTLPDDSTIAVSGEATSPMPINPGGFTSRLRPPLLIYRCVLYCAFARNPTTGTGDGVYYGQVYIPYEMSIPDFYDGLARNFEEQRGLVVDSAGVHELETFCSSEPASHTRFSQRHLPWPHGSSGHTATARVISLHTHNRRTYEAGPGFLRMALPNGRLLHSSSKVPAAGVYITNLRTSHDAARSR